MDCSPAKRPSRTVVLKLLPSEKSGGP